MKNLLSANRFGTSVASAAFAVTGMLVGSATFSSAQAATLGCPPNLDGKATGTFACEYSETANQDFLNPSLTVNEEEFFGSDKWEFIKRDEDTAEATGQSGEWSFDPANWGKYTDIMLIFKDGADTTLVGYKVTPELFNGTWDSPFENPPFDLRNTKDVSHISYYGTLYVPPVPEPLTMMGSAVALGFGGMFQKKRNAKKSGK
jgi:hypothetical protein